MEIAAAQVKKMAEGFGADIAGIAPAGLLSDAPAGFRPGDVLPGCRSVIVIAKRSLVSTARAGSLIPCTVMRNERYAALDAISTGIAGLLECRGAAAVPVPAGEPCVLDPRHRRLGGIISLKHAAVAAGLGTLGKNTLLVNDRFGTMLWLGAVLTTAVLDPDPPASYEGCIPGCRICLNACPVHALDGPTINQRACAAHAFGEEKFLFGHFGGWRIRCMACRTACPHCTGIPGPA